MASERVRMIGEARRRDADKVPVPTIAQALGYATWEEWTAEMTRPHPLLMDLKFVPVDDATYRASPARLPCDAQEGA